MKAADVTGMNEIGLLISIIRDCHASLAEQEQAFAELVRMFQDRAYACAYAVLGDFHLAEDAAQAAFISAWQKLDQLRDPEAFGGWLRRLVVSECHRLIRRQRLRTVPIDDALETAIGDYAAGNAQEILEQLELTKTVSEAIKGLSENERMVVLLFYVEQKSQKEIGIFLGVPVTTVAKRLYSARTRLRGTIVDGLRFEMAAHRPSRNRTFAEKVSAGIYDECVGQYQFEQRPELIVTIRRAGDKLFSDGGGQTNQLSAKRNSESELVTNEFDGRGRFIRDRRGRISHLVYYEFGKEMGRAKKIA
jgi:RNA polymerase sigma factor (sigma-70 family)